MNEKEIKPVAMNKTQLARLYHIDIKTFSTWLEKISDKIEPVTGRIYTPKQVQIIFDHLGAP